jgi:hypothetical protein
MPSVERKVESVNPDVAYSSLFVALETRQKLRRHRFAVPEDSAEHVALEASWRSGALEVRVENRLPHALPTGSFGRREVKLVASWPDGTRELAVAARPGSALAAGDARVLALPLPASARGAVTRLSLRRFDPASRSWQELAHAEALPPR